MCRIHTGPGGSNLRSRRNSERKTPHHRTEWRRIAGVEDSRGEGEMWVKFNEVQGINAQVVERGTIGWVYISKNY